MEIEIIPATPADTDRIFDFVCEQFYLDEPLRISLQLGPPEKQEEDDTPELLLGNCSFMAVSRHKPDIIYGVALNEEIKQQKRKMKWIEECKQYKGTNFGIFYEFLQFTSEEFWKNVETKCWAPTQTNSAMEIATISTHRSYRGQNIAGRLLESTEALAAEKGHRWLCIECTSAYSSALARKHGYNSIYKLLYSDYRDEKGISAIKAIEPHTFFEGLVKEINPKM